MGADIHFYIEKLNDNNKWEYIYIKNKDDEIVTWYPRDYKLFGLLAGVRGDTYDDLTKIRGLPYNMSSEVNTTYEKYKDDYHSATWYMLSELYSMKRYLEVKKENILLSDLYTPENKAALKEEYDSLIHSLHNFCNTVDFIGTTHSTYSFDKVRAIIWFDN